MAARSVSPTRDASRIRVFIVLVLCLEVMTLAACAHRKSPRAPDPLVAATATPPPARPPVAHYSRYTLVEMAPDAAQTDLLQQILDVHIPATQANSVGDTLRYVLLQSGYRLCNDPVIRALDEFPLPAGQVHLGPLPLGSILQLLVGRAWELDVDEPNRRICFCRPTDDPHAAASTRTRRHPRAPIGHPPALASRDATRERP